MKSIKNINGIMIIKSTKRINNRNLKSIKNIESVKSIKIIRSFEYQAYKEYKETSKASLKLLSEYKLIAVWKDAALPNSALNSHLVYFFIFNFKIGCLIQQRFLIILVPLPSMSISFSALMNY